MDNECIICFDNLNKYDFCILSCNHKYHYHCLKKWIENKNTLTKICPICENNVEITNIISIKKDNSSYEDNLEITGSSSESDSESDEHVPFIQQQTNIFSCCCYL